MAAADSSQNNSSSRAREAVAKHLRESKECLLRALKSDQLLDSLSRAADTIVAALSEGKSVLTCGNGGSMSQATHFAAELVGRYRGKRTPLPAISLSDPAVLTALANDFGYSRSFARWVESLGSIAGVLVVFTTTGESPNILEAVEAAQRAEVRTLAFTGCPGGALAGLPDTEIASPVPLPTERTQELHLVLVHALVDLVEQALPSDVGPSWGAGRAF